MNNNKFIENLNNNFKCKCDQKIQNIMKLIVTKIRKNR